MRVLQGMTVSGRVVLKICWPLNGSHEIFQPMDRQLTIDETKEAISALNDARFHLEEALPLFPKQEQSKIEATIQSIESVFSSLRARGIRPPLETP